MKRIEEFQEYYQSELHSYLVPLEHKRLDIVRRLKHRVLIVAGITAGLALALAGFIFSQSAGWWAALIAAGVVGVGGVVVFVVIYLRVTKGFVSEFKDSIISKIVQFVDPGLHYRQTGCIDQSTYMSSQIFQTRPDRYKGEDLVWGKIGKTEIQFSEIHSEYKTETRSKNGHRTVHWHTIFKGIFFIADFNKEFRGETIVLPDLAQRMLGRFGQKLQSWNLARKGSLVKLEDPEFERLFVVYSDDQIEARYLLSTSLMARIIDFANKTGKGISLSFVNSKLHVAISYDKNILEPKLFASLLNIKVSQEYVEDLLLVANIVEDFNLNTRIWTKQ